MEVAINNHVYQQAQDYAQSQGVSLSAVIENFLISLLNKTHTKQQDAVPDVVLSLLGAGEQVADNDLNGREAYYQYLQEKYQ